MVSLGGGGSEPYRALAPLISRTQFQFAIIWIANEEHRCLFLETALLLGLGPKNGFSFRQ